MSESFDKPRPVQSLSVKRDLDPQLSELVNRIRLSVDYIKAASSAPAARFEIEVERRKLFAFLAEFDKYSSEKFSSDLVALRIEAVAILEDNQINLPVAIVETKQPDAVAEKPNLVADIFGGMVGGFFAGGCTGLLFGSDILVGAAIGAVGGALQNAIQYIVKKVW